jgi:hypothetical protein
VCYEILKLGLKNVTFNSPNGVRVEYLDSELLGLMKQVDGNVSLSHLRAEVKKH